MTFRYLTFAHPSRGRNVASRVYLSVALIMPLFTLAGCALQDDDEGASAPGSSVEGASSRTELVGGYIAAKRLHELDLGSDHRLEFYEFAAGEYAVRETMAVDDARGSVISPDNATSLVAIYRAAVREKTSAVPAALVEADRLAAERAKRLADAPRPTSEPPMASEPTFETVEKASCSADAFGDDWGAQWFLNMHCVGHAFRDCHTNQAATETNSLTRATIRQMEGDFSSPGHMQGFRWVASGPCQESWWDPVCTRKYAWQDAWNFAVQPRTVEALTFTDSVTKRALGSSPCGHEHLAVLWD